MADLSRERIAETLRVMLQAEYDWLAVGDDPERRDRAIALRIALDAYEASRPRPASEVSDEGVDYGQDGFLVGVRRDDGTRGVSWCAARYGDEWLGVASDEVVEVWWPLPTWCPERDDG